MKNVEKSMLKNVEKSMYNLFESAFKSPDT